MRLNAKSLPASSVMIVICDSRDIYETVGLLSVDKVVASEAPRS